MEGFQTDRPCALVADDDPIVRMHAVEIVEEAGFRAFDAEHGDAAIEVLDQHYQSIVLLFTDVEMPGSPRDGFAVARYTAEQFPDISIVVASGNITPKDGDFPEGARFIAKPFNAEMVHGHLVEILPDGKRPEPLTRLATKLGRA